MANAALALAPEPNVTVHSDLLGPLSVEPSQIISFPTGIYGFPECRTFVLLKANLEGTFWLQSVEYGTLAFLLVDPFHFFDGYHVDLSPADLARLGSSDPTHIAVLAITTLPRQRDEPCTANLQGPILIDMQGRRGQQAVFADGPYGTREPLTLK